MPQWVKALLVGAPLLATAALLKAAPVYSVTYLGKDSTIGINDSGQVVGYTLSGGRDPSRATLYSGTGTGNTDLGTLGGTSSAATKINNAGQIVGDAANANNNRRATLFSGNGANNVDLGTLGGGTSMARGINSSGQVVGSAETSTGKNHATLFSRNGTNNIDLGTLGGSYSFANDINNNGQVVGWSYTTGDEGVHAALFAISGPNVDLGTLGGFNSAAYSLNNAGQAVGVASTNSGYQHATLFSGSGIGNIDLGTLFGGSTSSLAWDINDKGQVVGQARNPSFSAFAFLWSADMGMVALDDLLEPLSDWQLSSAYGVNESGQISAFGCNLSIGCGAVLLSIVPGDPVSTSTPEPASLALFGTGLLGALFATRKGRRRSMQPTDQAI